MLDKLLEIINYIPLFYWGIFFLIVIPAGAITAIYLNIVTNSLSSAIYWIAYLILYLLLASIVITWLKKNQHFFK